MRSKASSDLSTTASVLAFVALALFGAVILWISDAFHYDRLAEKLGEAVVIAGLVGAGIEGLAAKRLIDHAAHQMARYFHAEDLPELARAGIHRLLDTKVVARNYERTFILSRVDDDWVKLTSEISLVLVNNGRKTEAVRPFLAEEGIHGPILLEASCRGRSYVDADLRNVEPTSGVVFFRTTREIKLEPSPADKNVDSLTTAQRCDVRWKYEMKMPSTYTDVTAFTRVNVSPTLKLVSASEYEFSASLDNDCDHSDSAVWSYKKAFVPGEHVRVWWKPKTEDDGIRAQV